MKQFKFINAKKLRPFIPKEYDFWCGIKPYFTPILQIIFWRRIKSILKIIHNLNFDNRKLIRVLDIGCGGGFFSINLGFNFPNFIIKGIDILTKDQNSFLKLLFKKFSINFEIETQNIETKTAFPDNFFDMIVALDVLEHLENIKSAIFEIKRILKSNGILIISVPIESIILRTIRRFFYKLINRNNTYKYHWQGDISSVKEFNCLVKNYFKVEHHKNFPFNKFPLLLSYDVFYLLINNK